MKKFLGMILVFSNFFAFHETKKSEKIMRSLTLGLVIQRSQSLKNINDSFLGRSDGRAERTAAVLYLSNQIKNCSSQDEFDQLCVSVENLKKDLHGLLFGTDFIDCYNGRPQKGYEVFNNQVAQLRRIARSNNWSSDSIPARENSPAPRKGKKPIESYLDLDDDGRLHSPVMPFEIPAGACDEDFRSDSSSSSSASFYSYAHSLGHHFKNPSEESTPRWTMVETSDGSSIES